MDGRLTRRTALLGLAGLTTTLAGCGATDSGGTTADGGATDGSGSGDGGSTTAPPPADERLGADLLAEGVPAPLAVEPLGPGRLLLVSQRGTIFLVEDGETSVYLDIQDRLAGELKSEMGLIGLALHPEFASNGRLFVRYSADPRAGTPDDFSHTFVLAEFEADPGADAADASTERTILEIPEPQANHNAGNIVFGPDGYLYVGVGDGGRAGDQGLGHVGDWYDGVGGGNGQDLEANRLGSILRIDVDDTGGDRPYGIPDDNPLVGEPGFDEHFAWGIRNPWGMSFGPDGRLFVADVGQFDWEEVNVVEKGGNYGWNVREGTHCYDAEECPTATPDGDPLLDPVVEYGHDEAEVSGVAVVGGYLYDGGALPSLQGDYVFADFQSGGEVFVAEETDSGLWETHAVPVDHEQFGPQVTGFGRDGDGEILVCCVDGREGTLLRLTRA